MRTLLVVGRSSNGKSSVGNSILGDKVFSPRSPNEGTRLTNEKRSNNEYIVVDCSGIGDTEGDIAGDVQSFIQSALDGLMLCDNEKEMTLHGKHHNFSATPKLCNDNYENQGTAGQNMKIDETVPSTLGVDNETQSSQVLTDATQSGPDAANDTKSSPHSVDDMQRGPDAVDEKKCGFDALIFVHKYGVRFTKQEKDAVQIVKFIFGENVFRDWGILVFSYGDNFYLDTEDDGMTFEDWCREQTGDIKLLFEEVNYRCVVFDNKSTNKDKELENLKGNIEKVPKGGRPYTLENFDNAKRERVKKQLNHPYGGLQVETAHLLIKANQLIEQSPQDSEQFQKLQDDLLQHVEKIITLDEGTGVLKPLLEQVNEEIATLEVKMKQLESSEDVRSFVEAYWQYFVNWFWQTLENIRSAVARGIARVSPAPDPTNDVTMLCP